MRAGQANPVPDRIRTEWTEAEFTRAVIDLSRAYHLKVAHFRTSLSQSGRWQTAVQGDGMGYPDLTIVGRGGILFPELKLDRGRLSAEQVAWGEAIGHERGWRLWRTRDWASGLIRTELDALRKG